jgi:hypothetical protein
MTFNISPDRKLVLEGHELDYFEKLLENVITSDQYFHSLSESDKENLLDELNNRCQKLYYLYESTSDPFSLVIDIGKAINNIYVAIPQETLNSRGISYENAEAISEAVTNFAEEITLKKIKELGKLTKLKEPKSFLEIGGNYLGKSAEHLFQSIETIFINKDNKDGKRKKELLENILTKFLRNFVNENGDVQKVVNVEEVIKTTKQQMQFVLFKKTNSDSEIAEFKKNINPLKASEFLQNFEYICSSLLDPETLILPTGDKKGKEEKTPELTPFLMELISLEAEILAALDLDAQLSLNANKQKKIEAEKIIKSSFELINENYDNAIALEDQAEYLLGSIYTCLLDYTDNHNAFLLISSDTQERIDNAVVKLQEICEKRVGEISDNSDMTQSHQGEPFPPDRSFEEINGRKIDSIFRKLVKNDREIFRTEDEEFIKETRQALEKLNNLIFKIIARKEVDITALNNLIIRRLNKIFYDSNKRIKPEFNKINVLQVYELLRSLTNLLFKTKKGMRKN